MEEGVYRTTRPIPVHGGWKVLLRLHRDPAIVAVPIFMPEDAAIPAPEIPAEESSTREFEPDRALLMREAKEAPIWITAVAYTALIAILVAWVASIGWGLSRLRRTAPGRQDDSHGAPPLAVSNRNRAGRPRSRGVRRDERPGTASVQSAILPHEQRKGGNVLGFIVGVPFWVGVVVGVVVTLILTAIF